ncbi:MAG TPA: dihydrolipoyllysine-residue succinyltransferase, partial [Tenuifilaceae bacterium]|nr:dihydrolipoyllysine-residue succinyltransferase [Tenuifilaceae bacterium]
MEVEIRIPSPGESIAEVEIANWLADDGSWVEKDQEIAEIESEKATLPLLATHSGALSIKLQSGTAKVGAVACTINTDAPKPEGQPANLPKAHPEEVKAEAKPETGKEKVEQKVQNNIDPSTEREHVKVTPLAQRIMDEQGVNVDDIISGLRRITSVEVNQALSANISDNLQ